MKLALVLIILKSTTPSYVEASQSHLEEQCQYVMNYNYGNGESQQCTTKNHFGSKPTEINHCKNTTQCPFVTRITEINYMIQLRFLDQQIPDMLSKCCGDCSYEKTIVEDINILLANHSAMLKSSDIIYPVFGSQSSSQLYGFWFIPFMEAPPGLYIVKRKADLEIALQIIKDIISVWPLITILLSLALLAGFVIWLFETRTSTEEFPLSFVAGFLNGFWWAYISMTSGYVVVIYIYLLTYSSYPKLH